MEHGAIVETHGVDTTSPRSEPRTVYTNQDRTRYRAAAVPDDDVNDETQSGSGLTAERARRLDLLTAMRESGANPYPYRFDRTHDLAEVRATWADLEAGVETDGSGHGRGSDHAHARFGQIDLRHPARPFGRHSVVHLQGRDRRRRLRDGQAARPRRLGRRRGNRDDHPQGRAVASRPSRSSCLPRRSDRCPTSGTGSPTSTPDSASATPI